jgi:hypothetical protein
MQNRQLPQKTLIALLDELIPARDASLAGAGSLGLAPEIEAKLGETTGLIAAGLAALDEKAREHAASGDNTDAAGDANFADLASQDRVPLVSAVAAEHPGFIETLLFQTFTTYYQHPLVVAAIGLSPEPPYPGGYDLEEGDLGLLEPVRKRASMHREI